MKKVKEWFQEKNDLKNSEALFDIICRSEEGKITTVETKEGDFFSLGNYKINNSKDIFIIREFDENLKRIGFKIASNTPGDTAGSILITDIHLLDSDTIEFRGFMLKAQQNFQKVINKDKKDE